MKKIYNQEAIHTSLCDCPYAELLQSLSLPLFLIEYDAGLLLSGKPPICKL